MPGTPSVRIRQVTSREEWLAWRRDIVGASEAGAVLGIDPWRSPLAVYHEKAGTVAPQESSNLMERGIDLEPGIVNAVARRHPEWKVWQPQLFYDDPAQRVGCTPDAFFLTPNDGPTDLGVVQCKLVSTRAFESWNDGETPPLHYQLQTAIEAKLTGANRAILAAYVIGEWSGELREFPIPLDTPDTIQAYERFLEYNHDFWERLKRGDPPPLDPDLDADLVRRLYPHETIDAIDLSGDTELAELLSREDALFNEIADFNAHAKPLEQEREKIRTRIKAKIGTAAVAVCAGREITWKTQAKKASSGRVLRIKPLKAASVVAEL